MTIPELNNLVTPTPIHPIVRVKFLSEFKELFNTTWRYIVYYGGRASGKSQHTALALLIRGRQEPLRILCTREIQNTIKDSVHKLLKDLIEKHNFTDYEVTNDSIINNRPDSPGFGTEFIFKGLRRNTNEIKSTEGIDICWVEEAQSITKESITVLTPTIRKAGSQLIFTFNRFDELDPVYVEFVQNKPDGCYARKVNYDALERAGLLPDVIKGEIEKDRDNPELFAHKWLGEPIAQGEMAIIGRGMVLEAMQRDVTEEMQEGKTIVGVDVARLGADRTVFAKRKGLYGVRQEVHQGLKTTEVCDALEKFINFDKEVKILVDDTGVGGGVSDEMEKRGYDVFRVNFGAKAQDQDKYPNLISEAWFNMAKLIPFIKLPYDSDLLMELSTRQWGQDNRERRAVESKQQYKKRGFRSPDKADAWIICFYTVNQLDEDDVDII